MPQLPSGLLVALTVDPALEKAREGHSFFRAIFKVQVKSADDIDQIVSLLYYCPKEGVSYPGEPYLSGITLNAIGTDRCDWSQEDIDSFRQWLATDNTQQWLHTAYDNMMEAISNSKSALPENLKGIMDDEEDIYPAFKTGQPEDELPDSVITLIGDLIKRDNVQSVSCPFNNSKVWRLLVAEQVRRAGQTGKHLQQAFALSGPDSGFGFDPTEWAGEIHIPYEGAVMADLFVAPKWRNFIPETNSATLSKSYYYLIVKRDFGELQCAIRRDIGDSWLLYESTRPYVKVDVFGEKYLHERTNAH